MNAQGKNLLQYVPLFKFWAKELLYAFADMTYKSTFKLAKKISVKNMFVSEIGIKVYLKKIKFGDQKDDNLDYHLNIESQMCKMYAELLIELLTNQVNASENLPKMDIDPELKCILYECLRAEEKTSKQEEDAYDAEIQRHIQEDVMKRGGLLDRKDGSVSTKSFQDEEETDNTKAKKQPVIDAKTRVQFLDVVKNDTAA